MASHSSHPLPNLSSNPKDLISLQVAGRSSRYASQRSIQSSLLTPIGQKPKQLPPHVEEVLHARRRGELRSRLITGQGFHATHALMPGLDRKLKVLPWEKVSGQAVEDAESTLESGSTKKSAYPRHRKATQHTLQTESNKYNKLYEVLDNDLYGKITFTNSNEPMEVIPFWVIHRLQDSCRQARFGLPSDYRKLQDMTPLEYLEKHTFLSRDQRRRYDNIFTKHMDKIDKCVKFENLYTALNSMFANSLGKDNFYILGVALFFPPDFNISNKAQFAGICALTERLFWSSYMDTQENSFFHLGNNRSLLECADFNGLQYKLHGLEVSIEMRALLFSLA